MIKRRWSIANSKGDTNFFHDEGCVVLSGRRRGKRENDFSFMTRRQAGKN
jgi:hypothetical protein